MSEAKTHIKLGQFAATAICGNDILSSALYVSGIAAIFAGVYAPVVLLIVSAVLFLYRLVYREVVEALPVNGGAYNCLLNATSKTFAAVAGVMTILSYIATAVISAKVAIEYLHVVVHGLPIIPLTIALLAVFAVLVIAGVKDSAKVAMGIFGFHIITLAAVVVMGVVAFMQGKIIFGENILATSEIIKNNGGLVRALFLAFSASLLGISGFESSANFVEEQKEGVFKKTLNNMWAGVSFFNPAIALVLISILPIGVIAIAKDFVLADAAKALGGEYFAYWIVADAFLVLSGAVLTSYIGVTGLINRMALDGCLPSALLKENSKGSHPRIIITFFFLCTSILLITQGELLSLAGVYTISFLGVMSLFALGNLILRETRGELKRPYQAPIFAVIAAFLATATGIVGNILLDSRNLYFFGMYFVPSILVIFFMLYEDSFFSAISSVTKPFPFIHTIVKRKLQSLLNRHFIVFIHHPSRLYNALNYINRNEHGIRVTIVHCKDESGEVAPSDISFVQLKKLLPQLQQSGVFPHLKVEMMYKNKPFGPEIVASVAKDLKVPLNRVLIGSIHHYHDFDYHEFGGVRIISG